MLTSYFLFYQSVLLWQSLMPSSPYGSVMNDSYVRMLLNGWVVRVCMGVCECCLDLSRSSQCNCSGCWKALALYSAVCIVLFVAS